MPLAWLDARTAIELGVAFADRFAASTMAAKRRAQKRAHRELSPVNALLRDINAELPTLTLNIYQRARFAFAFKWRLFERGIERDLAAAVTQTLVIHISATAKPQSKKSLRLSDG
jgi:hypothetical protein